MTAIEQRIGELENDETCFPPETLAIAGAVVYLDHDVALGVRRGFIAPEDAAADAGAEAEDADAPAAEEAAAVSSLPHSLIESLTTHRTAALAVSLSQQHTVALAAVVRAIALRTFLRPQRR
jgi:ParB family transcriptional regulator, chromosome partitioning protein